MSGSKGGMGMSMAVGFFLLGFVLCVGGLVAFMKSDDTAFHKTNSEVKIFQADIQNQMAQLRLSTEAWAQNLTDLQRVCSDGFEKAAYADTQIRNTVGALELEIQRLKEKSARVSERSVPTTQHVHLKVDQPIAVEFIERPKITQKPPTISLPNSLLERSGIKKKK